jgi:RNA polymerase sigma factor (sigma-70 family)
MNPPDAQLLRRYAEEKSEAAFAELLRRHFDMVYSAAIRQVAGDAELARDITQTVFVDLARKAKSLTNRTSLAGWLYTSTHFAAAKVVRGEHRRRAREQEAFSMQEHTSETEADWERLRPTIDRAMHELDEQERDALLLRFFEQREFRALGETFGVSEEAARKRVERALEKLRAILGRHGLTSTSASLSTWLLGQAVLPAPPGLAATISGAALATTTTSGSLAALAQTIIMNKPTIAAVSALVLVGAVTSIVLQHRTVQRLRADNVRAREELASFVAAMPAERPVINQTEIDAAELERLRDEHNELLRLRGQVSRLRQQLADTGQSPANSRAGLIAQSSQEQPSPFANLSESEIPGRYRLTEGDVERPVLTFRPDGSFVTARGDVKRWALARDGLLVIWQTGVMRFTNIAAPGVYVGAKGTNQILRLEKIE